VKAVVLTDRDSEDIVGRLTDLRARVEVAALAVER